MFSDSSEGEPEEMTFAQGKETLKTIKIKAPMRKKKTVAKESEKKVVEESPMAEPVLESRRIKISKKAFSTAERESLKKLKALKEKSHPRRNCKTFHIAAKIAKSKQKK
jgi:hypothetical protein